MSVVSKLSCAMLLSVAVISSSGCSYNTSETKLTRQVLEHPVNKYQPLSTDITILGADKLEHEATLLARGCSAHTFTHSFSKPFLAFMEKLDEDGTVDQIADAQTNDHLVIEALSAHTSLRCVLTSTYRAECLTKMELGVEVLESGRTNIAKGIETFRIETVTRSSSCNDVSRSMIIAANEMLNAVGAAYSSPVNNAE